MPRKTKTQEEADLVAEVQQRFADCDQNSAETDNRDSMKADLSFCYVPGSQWEPTVLGNRLGRPCYSYNRTVQSVNQVVGDQRQARITGKVRAINKDASKETAEIFGGLIRNIEAISGAQYIYSDQFKYAVAGGFGAWRISPRYCSDDTFEQELYLEAVPNPFTAYWDHTATDPCKGDANWAVVAERLSKKLFEELYPAAECSSVDVPRDNRGWFTEDEVRVAEYWKRTCKDRKIAELSDGRVIDYSPELRKIEEQLEEMASGGMPIPTVERTRKTKTWGVTWWKVSGAEILEGPTEYKWKRIPLIRLPGRFVNIEGKQYVQSLHRHAKDAQRTYNYNRTVMVETAALTPRAPYIATGKMVKGYEAQWDAANRVNKPYLLYDADPAAPGAKPTREPPPDVPQALIALAAADAEDIKQTTGYVTPQADQQDGQNPESGIALRSRMMSGGGNAYEFTDNLERAVKLTHEMLIDMIPTVYDTERTVRIVGIDEVEDYITVNQLDPANPDALMNDLTKGAYDVTVTIGPAYATARQEANDVLMTASERLPIIAELGADIVVKNLDIEDADELRKRIRKRYIASGIVEPTEDEQKEMGPPPPPDPAQVALVERLQAQSARDQASAQKTAQESQMMPIEMESRIADIVNTRLEAMLKARDLAMTGADLVASERKKATDGVPST